VIILGLFTGKKNSEEIKKISDECLATLRNYISTTTDENRLNMIRRTVYFKII
jgi:adenylate cyclase